ncbi:hypothetical protein UPYG_G00049940 [Umbra pygmaea]|uniref:Uncharacterized protein n=1 Tax=Umbra pygmaea TaxID=75934 RepID=A0ABD0XRN0_UMBPY
MFFVLGTSTCSNIESARLNTSPSLLLSARVTTQAGNTLGKLLHNSSLSNPEVGVSTTSNTGCTLPPAMSLPNSIDTPLTELPVNQLLCCQTREAGFRVTATALPLCLSTPSQTPQTPGQL